MNILNKIKYFFIITLTISLAGSVFASNFLNYSSGFVANDDYVIDGDVKINNNFIESWFESGKGMHLRFSKSTSATDNKVHFGNSEGALKVYGNNFADIPLLSLNSIDGLSTPLGLLFGSIELKSINQAPFTSSSQLVSSSGDMNFINTSGGFKWNTTTPTTLTSNLFTVPSVLADGAGLTNLKWKDDLGTLLGADPIPNDILNGDDFPKTPIYTVNSSDLVLKSIGSEGSKVLSVDMTKVATPYHIHTWNQIDNPPQYMVAGTVGSEQNASDQDASPDTTLTTVICSDGWALCKIGTYSQIHTGGSNSSNLKAYCCQIETPSGYTW